MEEIKERWVSKGSPVKAPPKTKRMMMPPKPQQISSSSTDESQWQADWRTRERRVTAAMENYVDRSDDMKVEIEALELLMGQEEAEVYLMYILAHARRRGSRIFEIFRTKEKTDHLVAPRKDGRAAREAAQRLAGRKLWQRLLHAKEGCGRRCPAAELLVDKGGGKPVECSRKNGHGQDGAVSEQQ